MPAWIRSCTPKRRTPARSRPPFSAATCSSRLSTCCCAGRKLGGPNLDDKDARAALVEPAQDEGADYSDEALDLAIEVTGGYPYFLQELGPEAQKAQDVAAVIGRKSTQMGPTRAQLINMGLLYTPEHGYAAFTVPHFDKFLLRAIPELIMPPERSKKSRKED